MNQYMKLLIGTILLTGFLFLGGCIGPSLYENVSVGHYGYWNGPADLPGTYEINFNAHARNWDFVKSAGFYRCAELTYENNYRYFRVLKMEDQTQEIKSPGYENPITHMSLNPVTTYIPGIKIKIQCYAQRPAAACYDAYDYLNKVPVPGTKVPFTVDQRRAGGERPK